MNDSPITPNLIMRYMPSPAIGQSRQSQWLRAPWYCSWPFCVVQRGNEAASHLVTGWSGELHKP